MKIDSINKRIYCKFFNRCYYLNSEISNNIFDEDDIQLCIELSYISLRLIISRYRCTCYFDIE